MAAKLVVVSEDDPRFCSPSCPQLQERVHLEDCGCNYAYWYCMPFGRLRSRFRDDAQKVIVTVRADACVEQHGDEGR